MAAERIRVNRCRSWPRTGRLRAAVLMSSALVLSSGEPVVALPAPAPTTTVPTTVLSAPPQKRTGEQWRRLPDLPIAARSNAVSVWTGEELLVWRGQGAFTDACTSTASATFCGEPMRTDGARFNPGTGIWRILPKPPMPDDRSSEPGSASVRGVWTGREFVVWGSSAATGAAYDPVRNVWRKLPKGPLAARRSFEMVWDGRRVVIGVGLPVGKDSGRPQFNDIAAFSPTSGRWSRLPDVPAGVNRGGLVVSGPTLFLYNRNAAGSGPGATSTLFSFNAKKSRWVPEASTFQAPMTMVAVGSGRLVAVSTSSVASPAPVSLYSPDLRSWSDLPGSPVVGVDAIWTGAELIVIQFPAFVDSAGPLPERADAYALDLNGPVAWRPLANSNQSLSLRHGATIAWTGTEMIVIGGALSNGSTGRPLRDGYAYTPGTP